MIKQLPKFLNTIKKENKIAEKIAKEYDIDIIISDNRYGFRSSKTKNIFICHQLQIVAPIIIENILNNINHRLINKFENCWIPDTSQTPNLSGRLSNFKNNKTIHIGPLSRFKTPAQSKNNYKYKYIGIISGPEPHRTIIENKLKTEFFKLKIKCAIINGKTDKISSQDRNISFYSHQNTKDFKRLIEDSEIVICRSGYSSIMDLSILQKEAVFIPTPGQTEQEYLAIYHSKVSNTKFINQDDFSLEEFNYNLGKVKKIDSKKLLNEAFELCIENS